MDHAQSNIVEVLPQDMIVEILSRVGQKDSTQLFIAKTVCKTFLNASDDPLVYRRLSLDRFPMYGWNNQNFNHVLNSCLLSQNPNSNFRKGLMMYFDRTNTVDINEGLHLIKEACNNQLIEATYVYGLIMFANHQLDARDLGLKILNQKFPPQPDLVVEVRTTVWGLLRQLWRLNRHPFDDVQTHCTIGGHKGYFPIFFGLDHELPIPECMACFWSYEIGLLIDRFQY